MQLNSQLESILGTTSASVIPPFFWDTSGRATIHGALTTAQKLVGEQFFIMLYDDPTLARDILHWIVEVYIALINHFAAFSDFPITSIHVGECSGCLVSKEGFLEYAKPYIDAFGLFWPLRVHSCGLSDHLLDPLCDIKNLRSLDIGSNTSIAGIRSRLGPTFSIELAPPVEVLLEGAPPSDCLDWLEKTLTENNGGPLGISCHMEPGYTLERIQELYSQIQEREHPIS